MNPFQSLRDYENLVYTLPQQYASIIRSTLVVIQRGRLLAEVAGDVWFAHDVRLAIYERLTWDTGSLIIEGYSYEVWRGSEKLYWCDSQPHPRIPELASTEPHHKHIPPGIKHHRVPAPGLGFDGPNLDLLIREIERDLLSMPPSASQ